MARYHVRRKDRELTDAGAIASILKRGKYTAIAMCHDSEPYVVTLSYGYDAARNCLYHHAAKAGRKLDAIAEDPRVCATVVVDAGYRQTKCEHPFESVVFTGTMRVVTDLDEMRHGMGVLVSHLEEDPTHVRERNKLDGDKVYAGLRMLRLDIEEITGKAGS